MSSGSENFKGEVNVNAERSKSSTEFESVGAGAASGAAIGAVIALGVTAGSSIAIPVVGGLLGAAAGGWIGHTANTYLTKRSG